MAKRRAGRNTGGQPAAAAATAGPAAAVNSQEPHHRLFSCQRARKLKGTVEWRYRDDGGTQGPFSPDEMIKLYVQKRIHPETVIVGSNPDVKYPNLPGTKFYKPLSELIAMVTAGGHYEPCTKEDVKKGRPETGWNEGGGGAAGPVAAGDASGPHPISNPPAAGNRQGGNKGGSTDRSHHQPNEANGHDRNHHPQGKAPRNFNQAHGRPHGGGGRHGRNQHFAPAARDHPRNPSEVPPHMQPGAVVTRYPAKAKGPDHPDGTSNVGTPSKSSEDGSSIKAIPVSAGSLNTSQAGSHVQMGNHLANLSISNGHVGGGALKPGARELLHGLGNMQGNHMPGNHMQGNHMGGVPGVNMLHADVLHNFAAGRGMLQPAALLGAGGGGVPQQGFNPIVGAGFSVAQSGLMQHGGPANQFNANLGAHFGGPGAMHHALLQPRIRPELQQVLTGNSDNPKDHPSWWFLDSYGQVQGPHSPDEMLGWFIEGLIHPNTMVCSTQQEVVRPFCPGVQLFWPLSNLLDLAGKGMLRKPLGFMELQPGAMGPPRSQPQQQQQPTASQQQQQTASQQLGALLAGGHGGMGGGAMMHHHLMQQGLGAQMRLDHQGLLGRSLLLNSINAARPQTPGQPSPAATSLAAVAAAAAAAGQRPMFNLGPHAQHLGLQSPATTPSAAQLAFHAQLPQSSLPAQAAAQLAFHAQMPQSSLPAQAAAQLAFHAQMPQSSLPAQAVAQLAFHSQMPQNNLGPQTSLPAQTAAQLAFHSQMPQTSLPAQAAAQLAFHLQMPQNSLGPQTAAQLAFQPHLPQNSLPPAASAQLANLGSHIQNSLIANGPTSVPPLGVPQQSSAQQSTQTSLAQPTSQPAAAASVAPGPVSVESPASATQPATAAPAQQ